MKKSRKYLGKFTEKSCENHVKILKKSWKNRQGTKLGQINPICGPGK